MDRFELATVETAHVLWEYVKYIGGEFATFGYNTTPGGKGLLSLFNNEQVYNTWHDILSQTVTSKMMTGKLNADKVTCKTFIQDSSPMVSTDTINKVCTGDNADKISDALMESFVEYCYWQSEPKFKKIMEPFGFTMAQSNIFCGIPNPNPLPPSFSPKNFNQYITVVNRDMSSQYGCAFKTHCSRRELLAIQWTTAKVTMQPPSYSGLTPAKSITVWHPETDVSHFQFEMPNFAEYYNTTVPSITGDKATKLVSYDRILSPLSLAKAISEKY